MFLDDYQYSESNKVLQQNDHLFSVNYSFIHKMLVQHN